MTQDVAKVFSRAAETYDRGASLHRHVAAMLAELLPGDAAVGEGPILELGSGTGTLTHVLLQRYPQAVIHAVDVAAGMLQCLRDQFEGNPRVQGMQGDARTFRPDMAFPLVASSSALHWAVPLDATMANVYALTRPGGMLCAAFMVAGTLRELHDIRARVVPGKVPAGRLAEESVALAAIESAGFVLDDVRKELVHARYSSARDFLETIHAQGLTGGAVSRSAVPLTRGELGRIVREYDRQCTDGHGGVYAGYEVLCVCAVRKAGE